MNVISGELKELSIKNGTTIGKVHVNGSFVTVPMFFLLNANIGDTVLIEEGIAMSCLTQEGESDYVPGNAGQNRLN